MIATALGRFLSAGLLALLASLPASAERITWNLENITFADGATATGSFTIDRDTKTWWDFNVSSTGGTLAAFTFNGSNSHFIFGGYGPNSYMMLTHDGRRYINFSFIDALTGANAQGTHLINPEFSWECYNCNPWRRIASGAVTAESTAVPEPGTLGMLLPALGMIGWMSRRRKKARAQ